VRTQQVQAWVFRRSKGIRYLLLKRIASKGGFWQPISGGVEPTDTDILSAGRREVLEETGIPEHAIKKTIEPFYFYTIDKHYLTGKPITPLHESVIAFEVDSDEVRLDRNIYPEHSESKWAGFEEAMNLLKWEDNKTALKKLNNILVDLTPQ
jgi:dihydroneopterin triphosphate diphosphatase